MMKEILSFETIRIRNVLKDTKPIIYVADGCEDLSLGWDDVPSCHICKCRGSYYVSDEGRKESSGSSIPKSLYVYSVICLIFSQKEGCDEVAAYDEENFYSEKTA